MLNKKQRYFTVVFALILAIHLVCLSLKALSNFTYYTKPAIISSLLIFFISQSNLLPKTIAKFVVLALIFSLIGDIALLFEDADSIYFIIGLGAFLIAHMMYILSFLKQRNPKSKPLGFVIVLLVYAALLFYILKPGLGDMMLPVIIYMMVILSMSTTAFIRFKHVNRSSFNWVFVGALLFMCSDSILALNKFYEPIAYSHISIILTYAVAQYCIVIGLLKMNSNLR